LHHSDQGSTYASEDYQTVLETHGITCNMSGRGNCYDNAVMEAFFSTVKNEVGERYESDGEAKGQLFDYIEVFYNQRGRHSSAGRTSPAALNKRRLKPRSQTIHGNGSSASAAWQVQSYSGSSSTWSKSLSAICCSVAAE
jgi:transposase InsO family protein